MLPEQRKIIMENQKLLYSFRKRGTDLPEKALTLLSKKIDKAYKTMQKSIDELKQHNIILDSNDFLLNSSFAYFAGFYVTDDEVEVELLDFQLEPVLEKIVPALKKRVHYETIHEVMEIMKNMIDEISENVTIESISIIFNKCMNYQNKYVNILIDNMEQFNSIETTYMQIKALLNPEYFVFGGKWLRKTQFEDFITKNHQFVNLFAIKKR